LRNKFLSHAFGNSNLKRYRSEKILVDRFLFEMR